MQTKAKPARKAKAATVASRVEAAQAIRGFVEQHEQVIRYLNDVRLIPALHRVRGRHRPHSEAAVQVRFSTRGLDEELHVVVNAAGVDVFNADYIEFESPDSPVGRTRICRVYKFDDGEWVDAILAEAATLYASDKGQLTLRPGRCEKAAV